MSRSRTSSDKVPGSLIVISGPSGAGKGTIIGKVLEHRAANPDARPASVSISATTRAPRGQERDGVEYYFLTPEQFERMEDEGAFLEHANVFSHKYGTPKAPVLEKLARGEDVIFDIDVQGARQVKENYPDAHLIFITPPSQEVLRKRLVGRETEEAAQVEERLAKAAEEISHAGEYDHTVVNDDLERAVAEVEGLLDEWAGPDLKEE